MKYFLFVVFCLIASTSLLTAQEPAIVKGNIADENGIPLSGATVVDLTTRKGVVAGSRGEFQLPVAPNQLVRLEISFIGYQKDTLNLTLSPGETSGLTIRLKPMPELLDEVVVESWADRAEMLQQIDIRSATQLPVVSGNIESILTTLGASSRNEMSAQYSVRGGNYDENLIYVNDIEIYRPMLVKAGQQEGLSFINSDLVSSVQFAAGGFDARYGDKMSSVLDIRYKRPVAYAGSASVGLLGASAHLEGSSGNHKFTHITGVRYKANGYLLNTLETKGEYKPSFFDLQTFLTYDVSSTLEISFLGNMARNTYRVIPQSRETAFGTYQQPLNFTVYYEGQEEDRFTTLLGALTLDYHPTEKLSLKLTGSGFNTSEAITYDILSQYRIDMLDSTPGSETAGDSILNLGVGGNLIHARNYLDANILNLSHKGSYHWNRNNLNWGISWQSESFNDQIREWEMMDSAGYSLPYVTQELRMYSATVARNKLSADRFTGYLQDVVRLMAGSTEILLNAGVRFNYLNTNQQLVISPRAGIHIIPAWENKISFHASLGWYHQPPFYKEMSDPQGLLHTDIKAQQSVHYVVGTTWDFRMWERPFRFTAEAYYKKLDHLIPYAVDDVDIQYLPQYTAHGYATGIEFKINGEFVKDAESWATLSFLQTREDRYNDAYGQYPRPTDQLVNFGLFFQDYFPSNPSYRVHLNLYYGSRLPYNSTDYDNPEEYYHLKAYRRVDIALSKSVITDRYGNRRIANNFVKDLWFSIEVFNLFGFNNQASYQWVRTVSNQEGIPNMFAVPNYLTSRLLNLKLTVKF
jgi:hypothetical protein